MSTLTHLSDELLLDIFKYLDYTDIRNLVVVNKQIKAVSEDDLLWHNHPNILNEIWYEDELIQLIGHKKINSKNLAKLRGAWVAYRINIQHPPPGKKLIWPVYVGPLANMVAISVITKLELFHITDSPMAPSANPFKTAANIAKAQGWLSLLDGVLREVFMLVYNATNIPRRYPNLDNLILWIANSATAFFETRTMPNSSHIYRWISAGSWYIARQTIAARILSPYLTQGNRYYLVAFLISLFSVPLSALTMRALLGNNTPHETLVLAAKSVLTWKLWILPLTRLACLLGSLMFSDTISSKFKRWRHQVFLDNERKKFYRLLDMSLK